MYIKKDITTTAEDYKYVVYFTEYYRKKSNFLLMMLGALLAVVALTMGAVGVYPWWIGIIAAVVFLSIIPIILFRIQKKIKDGVKYGKVTLNTTRTVEFNGTDIHIYGGRTATDVSVRWDKVFAVYELEHCFLIYLTPDSAFCINKSQLLLNEAYEMRNEFIKRLRHRFYKRCK
ncbi:MAG: YcxB family protein [Eubacterium sp.]|nr:YcxB family protein [Eubacterium sp.]